MKRNIIRQLYFYAASLITLVIMVIAAAQLVNLVLKSTLFPKADNAYATSCDEQGNRVYGGYETPVMKPMSADGTVAEPAELSAEEMVARQARCEQSIENERSAERQREFVTNFSMLFVSAPVFWFHFRIAQREREEEKEEMKKEA